MCTKRAIQSIRGWTLVEMMVAVGVFSIAAVALGSLFIFSLRSFASMANYAILDGENRQAVDLLTREVRQAKSVASYSTNPPTLTLLNRDGSVVVYSFTPGSGRMIRSSGGSTKVLLNDCNLLNFNLYQRNPSNGNYGIFPVASGELSNTVKVIELTWKASRTLNATKVVNSENVQTARIVIRNQQD